MPTKVKMVSAPSASTFLFFSLTLSLSLSFALALFLFHHTMHLHISLGASKWYVHVLYTMFLLWIQCTHTASDWYRCVTGIRLLQTEFYGCRQTLSKTHRSVCWQNGQKAWALSAAATMPLKWYNDISTSVSASTAYTLNFRFNSALKCIFTETMLLLVGSDNVKRAHSRTPTTFMLYALWGPSTVAALP